jgi:PAS domain S-box-containing protein
VTTKDNEDKLLRSVALQNANSILIARRRAEQRSEFYLAEGQRLAHMGSWAFNPTGFFEYWSPELFQIFGLDPAKGAPTLDEYLASVHPQDREFMAGTIEKMVPEGSGCDVKQRILRPDGELRHVRWVGVPVFDEGVFKGFVGTAMDVTEQEHLTQELRQREAYLAEAQRLSHTGSFGWRISTGEILWSEETFRIFQYDRTTKPTMALVLQRVHPEDAALAKQIIERASQDGKDFDFEHRLLMPDGSVKYVHVVAHALTDESGNPEYVGSAMDITEQHQAKAALEKALAEIKKSEDQLRIIIDTIPTLAWCTLPDGSAEFLNQRWLDYTGLSTEEARNWGWRVALHAEDSTKLMDKWRAAVATGEPFEAEARFRRADGTYRWCLARAVPLRDKLGNIVQWYGTNTDIEDLKRAEEELHKAQNELAHVTRVATLGEMTASIAHEINQPLAAVVNNASACLRWLEASNQEEARQSAALIIADGHRAGEIISRIRALAKNAPPQKDWLNINETILEVITLARSEVQGNRVSLQTQLSDELPLVLGDRIQLQQVILNLVMNGIEAMSAVTDRSRDLLIRSCRYESDKVLVAVQDSGTGLETESLDHLFTAFFTTKAKGMGMGLAISRSIIEAHGGRLWATPNDGAGATFQFTLAYGGERVS